jgi:hypothetical protein
MSIRIPSSASTMSVNRTISTSASHDSNDGSESFGDATTLIGSSLKGSMNKTLLQRYSPRRKEWTYDRGLVGTHHRIVYQFDAYCVCRKSTPSAIGGYVSVRSGDGDAPLFEIDFRIKSHRETQGDGTMSFWFMCPSVDDTEPRKFGEAEFFLEEDYQDTINRLKAKFNSRFDAVVGTEERFAWMTASLRDSLFKCLQDACEKAILQLKKHDARIERNLAWRNFFRGFCCCSS